MYLSIYTLFTVITWVRHGRHTIRFSIANPQNAQLWEVKGHKYDVLWGEKRHHFENQQYANIPLLVSKEALRGGKKIG